MCELCLMHSLVRRLCVRGPTWQHGTCNWCPHYHIGFPAEVATLLLAINVKRWQLFWLCKSVRVLYGYCHGLTSTASIVHSCGT